MNTPSEAELAAIFDGAPFAQPLVGTTESEQAMTAGILVASDVLEPALEPVEQGHPAREADLGDATPLRVDEGEGNSDVGGGSDAQETSNDELLKGVLDDLPATVEDMFPHWRLLFKRRPFLRLCKHPQDGRLVLLLGYGYRKDGEGTETLDNSQVDGTMYRDLVSLCPLFRRANEADTMSVSVAVLPVKAGTKVKAWTNIKDAKGGRRDIMNQVFVVEGLRLRKGR